MKLSKLPKQSLDEVLEHHGVKGMRWGVRRTDAQLARAAKARKAAAKEDKKADKASRKADKAAKKADRGSRTANVAKKAALTASPAAAAVAAGSKVAGARKGQKKVSKTANKLSDDQLRKKINRLQMEKQYKELTTKPSLLSAGSKFVGKAVSGAAQQTLQNTLAKEMTGIVESQLASRVPASAIAKKAAKAAGK